jgi:hypothetical protein
VVRYNRYTPERRERALNLAMRAISRGWSLARFARWSRVPKGTLLEWIGADDATFDRYMRAQSTKAAMIPDMAMDVVDRVLNGRAVTRMVDGKAETRIEYLDPKAARVALTHFEFRMQRELKRGYGPPVREHNHIHRLENMSDGQIDERIEELKGELIETDYRRK